MKGIHLVLALIVLLISCTKDDIVTEPKKSNFSSPAEFLKNPAIESAIKNSGIEIYEGNSPPTMEGTYALTGEYTDASATLNALIGSSISSEMTLFDQTSSGQISLNEKAGNYIAWASGGFITGKEGKFTVWQESTQTGSEAGLPEDLAINVALLMSGKQLSNGNLKAGGISIITEVNTTNPEYDTETLEGVWWVWEADFELK